MRVLARVAALMGLGLALLAATLLLGADSLRVHALTGAALAAEEDGSSGDTSGDKQDQGGGKDDSDKEKGVKDNGGKDGGGKDEAGKGDGKDEGSGAQGGEEQPPPKEAPEGVHRARPRTAEEEREYKLRKTREDPFLNPPPLAGPPPAAEGFYNPTDWLRPTVQKDAARYVVQDAGGNVAGYLSISTVLYSEHDRNDTAVMALVFDFPPRSQVQLWMAAKGLKPERCEQTELREPASDEGAGGAAQREPAATAKTKQAPAGKATEVAGAAAPAAPPAIPAEAWSPEQEPPRLTAEYLFDRVTIHQTTGAVSFFRELRQLPFSFDIHCLPLLIRQLDFTRIDWPFEAALTDPVSAALLPLSVAKPERVENVYSAEPYAYPCFEFKLNIGGSQATYWVQRLPPYRLVKFTDGVYTYTLFMYAIEQ